MFSFHGEAEIPDVHNIHFAEILHDTDNSVRYSTRNDGPFPVLLSLIQSAQVQKSIKCSSHFSPLQCLTSPLCLFKPQLQPLGYEYCLGARQFHTSIQSRSQKQVLPRNITEVALTPTTNQSCEEACRPNKAVPAFSGMARM
jgi:hypothetical protein